MIEQLKKHIEKVTSLTEEEFSFVSSQFIMKSYRKNEFVFQKEEEVTHCYYVVLGLLKLVYDDENGKQHIVSFAMEDWWESDFHAYFNQTKASMSLQCLEETIVYSLSLDSYQSLCKNVQKMQTFFLSKSNLGFIGSQQRVLSLLTSNAKDRYMQLLDQYPSLLQRVSKTQLAAYLGSFSRDFK